MNPCGDAKGRPGAALFYILSRRFRFDGIAHPVKLLLVLLTARTVVPGLFPAMKVSTVALMFVVPLMPTMPNAFVVATLPCLRKPMPAPPLIPTEMLSLKSAQTVGFALAVL